MPKKHAKRPNFNTLSGKYLLKIFSYISIIDIESASCVNQRWRKYLTHETYWETLGSRLTGREEPIKPYKDWESCIKGFRMDVTFVLMLDYNLVQDRIWLMLRSFSSVRQGIVSWPGIEEKLESDIRDVVGDLLRDDVDILMFVPLGKKALKQFVFLFCFDGSFLVFTRWCAYCVTAGKKGKYDVVRMCYWDLVDYNFTLDKKKIVISTEYFEAVVVRMVVESSVDVGLLHNLFTKLVSTAKYVISIASDPLLMMNKKIYPIDELKNAACYSKAAIVTFNREMPQYSTPYFREKFLKESDITPEIGEFIGSTFGIGKIRPEFPTCDDEDPAEFPGFERPIAMIDTSGAKNTREFGLVFGRRGLYIRNSNLDGKFKHGGFIPYQVLEHEFPKKILPKLKRNDKKGTSVRIGYGCVLELMNVSEVVSNDDIINLMEQYLEILERVREFDKKKEEEALQAEQEEAEKKKKEKARRKKKRHKRRKKDKEE